MLTRWSDSLNSDKGPEFGFRQIDVACLAAIVAAGFGLELANGTLPAYVLLLVALLASITSPYASVTAIVIALPFVQRPVDIGESSWMLLEISILLAATSVGVRVGFAVVRQRTFENVVALLPSYTVSVAGSFLVLIGFVSLFTVADPRYRPESVREFRWVIVEPLIALALFRWMLSKGRHLMLLGTFLATGSVVAIASAVRLATGSGVVLADGVERATGPYLHPNNLALYLERVAILALAFAILIRSRRSLLITFAVISAVGLALTLSRGAAIAYVAGGLWIVVAARVRHGRRWIAVGAVAALAILGVFGADRLTDRGSGGARSSRELIWSSSIQMIRDHPTTGVGLDQFLNQYERRYVEPAGWPERYTSHPHNIVLDFWLRLGLAGLGWLVVMYALTVRFAISVWRRPQGRSLHIAALSVLVTGAVHGLVDNSFFLPDLAVVTWLMVALIERDWNHGTELGFND